MKAFVLPLGIVAALSAGCATKEPDLYGQDDDPRNISYWGEPPQNAALEAVTDPTLKGLIEAANKGDNNSQLLVSRALMRGEGVPQDRIEAFRWLRLAANSGNEVAQLDLGRIYSSGEVATRDLVLAHMWFNLAASQRSEEAAKQRNEIESRMTGEQVAKAESLARNWRKKSYRHLAW